MQPPLQVWFYLIRKRKEFIWKNLRERTGFTNLSMGSKLELSSTNLIPCFPSRLASQCGIFQTPRGPYLPYWETPLVLCPCRKIVSSPFACRNWWRIVLWVFSWMAFSILLSQWYTFWLKVLIDPLEISFDCLNQKRELLGLLISDSSNPLRGFYDLSRSFKEFKVWRIPRSNHFLRLWLNFTFKLCQMFYSDDFEVKENV